jgi:hypothetical protein
MVNVMLTNPEIQRMVGAISFQLNSPVKSSICMREGPGVHELDRLRFLNEQKSFLLNGVSFRGVVKDRENRRALKCAKLFK